MFGQSSRSGLSVPLCTTGEGRDPWSGASPSVVYPEPQSVAQLSSFVCVTVARPLPWVRRVDLGQAWTAVVVGEDEIVALR